MFCKCGSNSYKSKTEVNSKLSLECHYERCDGCGRTTKHELRWKDKYWTGKEAQLKMQKLPEKLRELQTQEDVQAILNS